MRERVVATGKQTDSYGIRIGFLYSNAAQTMPWHNLERIFESAKEGPNKDSVPVRLLKRLTDKHQALLRKAGLEPTVPPTSTIKAKADSEPERHDDDDRSPGPQAVADPVSANLGGSASPSGGLSGPPQAQDLSFADLAGRLEPGRLGFARLGLEGQQAADATKTSKMALGANASMEVPEPDPAAKALRVPQEVVGSASGGADGSGTGPAGATTPLKQTKEELFEAALRTDHTQYQPHPQKDSVDELSHRGSGSGSEPDMVPT